MTSASKSRLWFKKKSFLKVLALKITVLNTLFVCHITVKIWGFSLLVHISFTQDIKRNHLFFWQHKYWFLFCYVKIHDTQGTHRSVNFVPCPPFFLLQTALFWESLFQIVLIKFLGNQFHHCIMSLYGCNWFYLAVFMQLCVATGFIFTVWCENI